VHWLSVPGLVIVGGLVLLGVTFFMVTSVPVPGMTFFTNLIRSKDARLNNIGGFLTIWVLAWHSGPSAAEWRLHAAATFHVDVKRCTPLRDDRTGREDASAARQPGGPTLGKRVLKRAT
jgi:hypothetical protein